VFIGEGCDLIMPECGDSMSNCSSWRLIVLVSLRGVLQGLPRILMPREVILFPVLLTGTMGVRRAIV